jgi:hypothetical protein
MEEVKIKELCGLIEQLRHVTETLKEKGDKIQAIKINTDRILANIKMLELNVSDVRELL